MTLPPIDDTFVPPAPGGWKRLADHFPGALTPEYQRLYAETCPPGMSAYMARYGVLARTLDVAFVHGHLYITPVPLVGPREMKHAPPAAAVWLMSRLHPEFRRRTRAARRALAERPWRTAAAHWFEVERAQWIERSADVERVDLAALTTDELTDHLTCCRLLVTDGYRRHFELHGDDLLPIGLLIARCTEWGVEANIALQALDSAAPVAPVTSVPTPWQLITGYDLDSLARIELPSFRESPGAATRVPLDLRPLVASDHHDELNRLVSDARTAVPLRDDNGALTGAWPMGLLRRAMIEAGRRIALSDPVLAVEATVEELIALLHHGSELDEAGLSTRRRDRQRRSRLDAPLSLGPEFSIPPLRALPRPLALIGAAQLAAADHMLGTGTPIGVGSAAHTGRVLIVDDPDRAVELIEPGDVVVTRFTSPSWNAILVDAGAIVTTTGGLVSHAAVLARELAIPAVLGDTTAMTRLATGMIVTVDPATAAVVVHDASVR